MVYHGLADSGAIPSVVRTANYTALTFRLLGGSVFPITPSPPTKSFPTKSP